MSIATSEPLTMRPTISKRIWLYVYYRKNTLTPEERSFLRSIERAFGGLPLFKSESDRLLTLYEKVVLAER